MSSQSRRVYKTREHVYGNTARQVEMAPDIRRREQEVIREKRQVSAAIRKNRARALCMNRGYVVVLSIAAVIMFGICIEYLHTRAEVTNRVNSIASLESTYENLTAENDAKEKSLNASVDLNEIKEEAIALGMSYPSEDQIETYTDSNSDYVNQYSEIPEN